MISAYDTDRALCRIEKQLKLLANIKPTNLHLEKQLFFTGKRRNPEFCYRKLSFDTEMVREELQGITTDQTPLGMLLKKKKTELLLKLELLQARGSSEFSEISSKLYGKPDQNIEADAIEVLKTHHRKSSDHRKFSTEEIQEALERTLVSYGLTKWHVRLKDNLVSDVAAGKRNSLFLGRGISFHRERLERIIAHEIETHIITAENGKYQPFKLFQRGFANYLETQEGLAIYSQECQANCLPLAAHRVSYLALSVISAARGSFREVYEYMRGFGLSEEKSFRMALRVKRGLSQTEEKGAFTKDLIYLSGYRKIEKFAKDGGDLRQLFVGKIALEDLPFISKIPGIRPPQIIPRWLDVRA